MSLTILCGVWTASWKQGSIGTARMISKAPSEANVLSRNGKCYLNRFDKLIIFVSPTSLQENGMDGRCETENEKA